MNELKTSIEHYPHYFITEKGDIWSEKRQGASGRWLKQCLDKGGYNIIQLCKYGENKTHLVHRLVAKTFIPNLKNKPEINHKNGIKTDNRVENLEWVTSKENDAHARNLNLIDTSGENSGQSKLTWEQVNDMRNNHNNRKKGEKTWMKYKITYRQYYNIINNFCWIKKKRLKN